MPSDRSAIHTSSLGGSSRRESSRDIGLGLLGFGFCVHRDAPKIFSQTYDHLGPLTPLCDKSTSPPPSPVKVLSEKRCFLKSFLQRAHCYNHQGETGESGVQVWDPQQRR